MFGKASADHAIKPCSMKSRLRLALGIALAGATIVGTLTLHPVGSFDDNVLAQNPDSSPTGWIQEINATPPFLTVATGGTVQLSINLIARQDFEGQNPGKDGGINWSVTGGKLEVHYGTTRATYFVPSEPGTYTVTASAGAECIGNTADCNATFTVRARSIGPLHIIAPRMNPPGEIPTVLTDAEGNQYTVFTPAEGGMFKGKGADFRVVASHGDVPSGEFIGVRMLENGPALNVGLSHHLYTLRGNQYTISIIDAEGAQISSYKLNGNVQICIPVPEKLRTNLSNLGLLNNNRDGTLTVMSSSLRISPSLIMCGNTSRLPATVAVGIPGSPLPLSTAASEPAPGLPVTGGNAPTSSSIFGWVLLAGIALVAFTTIAIAMRSVRSHRKKRHTHLVRDR